MKPLMACLLFICVLTGCFHDDSSAPPPPERITFAGSGDLGIFDPSITRDPATGTLWMSYSAVDTSVFYAPTTYWSVSIRLASSIDNGVSWTDAGFVVTPFDEQVVGPMMENNPDFDINAVSAGIWQSETSTLIYDPNALPNEQWKLIWFQYLNANLVDYFSDYSWIAMKMAATPEGLELATAVKLFGGFALQPESEITATAALPHIANPPAIHLDADLTKTVGGAALAELSACVFAEPGLHATSSAIYMTIFCADISAAPAVTEYLVYFRCLSPCDMTDPLSWEYVGRLLSPTDAQAATGDDHFQAPALVEKNGKTYLIVTPVDTALLLPYDGCRVYQFTDVNSNALVRSGGQLVEMGSIDGDANTQNGACAEWSGLNGGILLSQFDPTTTPETFRIFKSQVSLP